MKKIFKHDSRAQGRQNFTWREILEDLRVLKSVLTRLILVLTDGLTKEWCIAVHLFIKQLSAMRRASGPLFTALYLKQCRVCLQRYIAKDVCGSFPDKVGYSSLDPFIPSSED